MSCKEKVGKDEMTPNFSPEIKLCESEATSIKEIHRCEN